jgi:hypothetical protein
MDHYGVRFGKTIKYDTKEQQGTALLLSLKVLRMQ